MLSCFAPFCFVWCVVESITDIRQTLGLRAYAATKVCAGGPSNNINIII